MAKTIKDAHLVSKAGQSYVTCTVEMPIAEFAAFIALAGLTDSTSSAAKAFIAARLAAGATAGQ